MSGPRYEQYFGKKLVYTYNHVTNSWSKPTVTEGTYGYLTASYTTTRPVMTRTGYMFINPADYHLTVVTGASGTITEYQWAQNEHAGWWVPSKMIELHNATPPTKSHVKGNVLSMARVVQEALAKLDNEGSSTNMEMMTKDLVDAMKLSNEYFTRLLAAAPALRKGKFKLAWRKFNSRHGQLRSTRKSISDHWLAFQWGVKPSLETCINAYNFAVDSDDKRTFKVTSSFKSKAGRYREAFNQKYPVAGEFSRTCYITRHITDMSYRDFLHLWDNPIVPAWDAIPWSFLVDWFVPVGDYLTQFGYYKSSNRVSGSDAKVTIDSYGGSFSVAVHEPFHYYLNEDYTMEKVFSFDRAVSSELHASYTLADIVDKSAFGVTRGRLVNCIALCNQKLGRH